MDCKEEKFEIIFESHIYIIVYDLWDEKHFILMLILTAEIKEFEKAQHKYKLFC